MFCHSPLGAGFGQPECGVLLGPLQGRLPAAWALSQPGSDWSASSLCGENSRVSIAKLVIALILSGREHDCHAGSAGTADVDTGRDVVAGCVSAVPLNSSQVGRLRAG